MSQRSSSTAETTPELMARCAGGPGAEAAGFSRVTLYRPVSKTEIKFPEKDLAVNLPQGSSRCTASTVQGLSAASAHQLTATVIGRLC